MNNFLLFLATCLVVLLGVAFAAPQYVDWDDYRGAFEDEASRVLGRPIRVGGRVDVRLLPTPYVRFERFRVADQDGHFGRPLFKADVLKMWVSVVPLFRGVIEAKHVELRRPRLRLVFDEEGRGNWRGIGMGAGATAIGQDADGNGVRGDSYNDGAPGLLPTGLLPGKIALQNITIKSGLITVFGPGDHELFKLTSVNGDLSARAAAGPYQFKGDVRSGGRKRDIKIVSRRHTPDGAVPFKAIMDDSKNGARFVFDGLARDLSVSPKFDGKLTAKLPLILQSLIDARARAPSLVGTRLGKLEPAPNATPRPTIDLKSKLTGDAKGLKLTDLSLSFEQAGRPQLLTGEVITSWEKDFSTTAKFAARWLDLDKIAGAPALASPALIMSGFIGQLDRMLVDAVISRAVLKIDQANLGGDVVSNILLDLSKRDQVLEINALRAEMPGRSNLHALGRVTGGNEARAFNGDLLLHGANLKQFLSWMAKARSFPVDAQGRFGLNAHMATGPGFVKTSSIVGEIGDISVSGSVGYDWSGGRTRALNIDLQLPRLDATRLLPADIRIGDMLASLMQLGSGQASAGQAGAGRASAGQTTGAGKAAAGNVADAAAAKLANGLANGPVRGLAKSIKLRVGQLITSRRNYHDVVVDVALMDDVLTVGRAKLSSGDELSADLSGRIEAMSSAPKGQLRGSIYGANEAAISALARMFQLPGTLVPSAQRGSFMAPLRLAGEMALGQRHARSTDLTLSGTMQGAPTSLVLRLGDRGANWRQALVDVSLDVDSSDLAGLVGQLLPAAKGHRALRGKAGGFVFNAVGVPRQGLATLLTLKGEGLAGAFDGKIGVLASDRSLALASVTGKVELNAQSLAPYLSLLHLDGNLVGRNTPASGSFKVTHDGTRTSLDDIQMVIARSGITGTLALVTPPKGKRKLIADLTARKISTVALLTPLLGTLDEAVAGASYAIAGGTPMIWPNRPFSFAALQGLEGRIKLKTAGLTLGQDLTLANARLDIELGDDRIVLKSLNGDAFGGRLSGALQVRQAQAGAKLSGSMKLSRVDLGKIFTTRPLDDNAGDLGRQDGIGYDEGGAPTRSGPTAIGPTATGKASIILTYAGEALSPRGLMSVMRGSGLISLGSARLLSMAPQAIIGATDAVLDAKPDNPDEAIRRELRQRFGRADLPLGPRTVKLTIADGALRADKIIIDTPEGVVATSNRIDLASLTLTSRWQVTAKARRSEITGRMLSALPPVTLSYSGGLGQIGDMDARIDAQGLVRELTVREMERDVERLEQIRKTDEERAKRDATRRQALGVVRERQRQKDEADRLRAPDGQPLPDYPNSEPPGLGAAQPLTISPPAPLEPASTSARVIEAPLPIGEDADVGQDAQSAQIDQGQIDQETAPVVSAAPRTASRPRAASRPRGGSRPVRKRSRRRKPKSQSFWDLFN